MKTYTNELYHHGILGQKWGKRNGPPYPLDSYSSNEKQAESASYYRETSQAIKTNSDGSYTIPKGFVFNRVGKNTTQVRTNQTGGLYVSYGKPDASRYVKIYGPDFINRITGNTREAIQHISVTGKLRLASDDQFVSMTGKFLKENPDVAKAVQEDAFLGSYLDKKSRKMTAENIDRMIADPKATDSKQMAFVFNAMFVMNEEHGDDIKKAFNYYQKNGYDAIPDIHDTWAGTSETAMIVLNPNKVKVIETTLLTKEIFDAGKAYVKTLGRIPEDEAFKKL